MKKEEIEPSILHRFETIVRLYPHRLAVKTKNHALTYQALNQAANRIARAILAARGRGSECLALLFESGSDLIAAIFGVLKAGKFYLVLDPYFPKERNEYMLEHSEASLMITNQGNLPFARALISKARSLLNVDEIGDPLSPENLELSVSPADPVAIRYTSGSTGNPKGVVETHRYRLHNAMIHTDKVRAGTDDRLSLLHSLSFASADVQLARALLNGASLFPFDIKSESIKGLVEWLRKERITVYHSSPAMFRQLAEAVSGAEKLPDLRVIHLSGASITELDFELYKENFPAETLLALHMGATETGIICSAVVDRTFCFPKEGSPAGYPVPDKRVLLLDENGSELAGNEIGEIAVRSRYLTAGYWCDPDLTASRFLPDPTGGNEIIYRTGDLGRMLPDGMLTHLGRKDFQIKIRGYRVEIGEIEKTLMAHPRIKDAGVVAWNREPGEKYLVGYLVPRGNPVPTLHELHDFIKKKLPDYMIPSAFVFLESLPLNNGKLDRAALPLPDHKRPEMRQPFVPPQTELEQKLAWIWEEVLDVQPIGIHDDFFDLGGHSLSGTQVISRLNELFGLDLTVRALFESPTVAKLASSIAVEEVTASESKPAKK